MASTTDYGKRVKIKLIEMNKSQIWLANEIRKKTGLYCDPGYLWKILADKVKSEKIVTAINEILGLEE